MAASQSNPDLVGQVQHLTAAVTALLERTSVAEESSRQLREELAYLERRPHPPITAREPKMEAPQKFSGEAAKLRSFLAQLVIAIRAQPSHFTTN